MSPSGRPDPGEFADYAATDVARVQGDDVAATLAQQLDDTLALLRRYDPSYAYAVGKWTVKEIVGHLSDDERIFGYRALCLSRGDEGPLPGFDEKLYPRSANFGAPSFDHLLDELRVVRESTVVFSRTLSVSACRRRGLVSGQ